MTERKSKNQQLIDGLRRFQDEFVKDFSFRDIQTAIEKHLGKNDFVEIRQKKTEEEKIEKLFFHFIYVQKDVKNLVNCLENSYPWLYKKIMNSGSDKWISDYNRGIQDIPNNSDWNVHRTKYLWEIQHHLRDLQRSKYLILFGKSGLGKRWLAADACRDFSVVHKMNFKVYWLNVSKCTTQELILEKLHRLKVLLETDNLDIKYNTYNGSTKNEIIHMRNYLRKIMEQPDSRECLIVLADVQDEKVVKAFDLNCKIFITTRHIEKLEFITNDRRTKVDIDKGFSEDESVELFKKSLKGNLSDELKKYVESFHKICKGHPFLMTKIARSLLYEKDEGSRQTSCKQWHGKLQQNTLIDDQIKMSVKESLNLLTHEHQLCYRMMVIFTDNSQIPFKVLEKIWDTDSHKTGEIVSTLRNYSLLESDENEKVCSLHYLHFNFLKSNVEPEEQVTYHRQLVEKYDVERIFKSRTQLELNFPNDNYFHYYIPYHLVGAKMEHLFEIYLDFGFLEQKMRFTLLQNTVGDLICFESQIAQSDRTKLELLDELKTFLAYNEQLIYKSVDVTLLQCALNSSGPVKIEAQRQIEMFRDRVWINDFNHEENHTQIVQISGKSNPHLVRFVKPNDKLVCLITLQNNNILLHDITQDYSDDPILYQNDYWGSKISEMQVFRHDAFLTLNENGNLSVYTLKSHMTRRPSGPSKTSNASKFEKLIQKLNYEASDRITCFNVFDQQEAENSKVDLIVGTAKGNIKFYQWTANKFEDKKQTIKSGCNDLFRMAHVNNYAMLLNLHGEVKYINLINSSTLGATRQWNKLEYPINLHQGMCSQSKRPITICVSRDKVVQVTHEADETNRPVLFVEYDDVFEAKDDDDDMNQILSSTMSKDTEYLILGTKKGIIVLHRFSRKVIYRRNVSDQVLSLDIYRYQDEAMYILSSVFKDAGPVINLYAFNKDHEELGAISNEMTFLVGEDLFDIQKSVDGWEMVAVDTKRNVHYRYEDNFMDASEMFEFSFQIKKISYWGANTIVVGCTNGSIYTIDESNETTLKTSLMSEVCYLECFGDVAIASCNSIFKLIGIEREFYGRVAKAYRYDEQRLLLIKKDCAIEIINVKTGAIKMNGRLADHICTAQAYQGNTVAISTDNNWILICNLTEDSDALMEVKPIEVMSQVTALALSADKAFLAVGYINGTIEIVNLLQMVSTRKLESHQRAVTQLCFSPWSGAADPLILLSLADSIVFWDIRAIQSNGKTEFNRQESTNDPLKVSRRWRKFPIKPLQISDTGLLSLLTGAEYMSLKETNPWDKKIGSNEKPELLSCIKLIAKTAKRIICSDDFARFVTIDNEGNIYYLRLITDAPDSQKTIDFNGNRMRKIQ